MSNQYDAIVLGGDLNALTAASVLAEAGKKVVMIDPSQKPGGMATELALGDAATVPGFLHDTTLIRQEVINGLKLQDLGLTLTDHRHTHSILHRDGSSFTLPGNRALAVSAVESLSKGDQAGFAAYCALIDKIKPIIYRLFTEAPPDLFKPTSGELYGLVKKLIGFRSLGSEVMTEFLKVAPMSAKDFLDEKFESESLKSLLAYLACKGSFASPMSSYSTLNLLLWECLSRLAVNGGPQAVADVLNKKAATAGVTIHQNTPIAKILIRDNAVYGVETTSGTQFQSPLIYSSLTPSRTFFDLCEPFVIPAHLEQSVTNFRSCGHVAKLHVLLKSVPERIKDKELNNHIFLLTGSMTDQEKAFDPIKYGELTDDPILEVRFSQARSGGVVASILASYVPNPPREGWTKSFEKKLTEVILNKWSEIFGGAKDQIIATDLWTPQRIENQFGMTGGHMYHGEMAIDQLFARPFPSCARYHTPIQGLILCGSSSFPGGGLSGTAGFLAANHAS